MSTFLYIIGIGVIGAGIGWITNVVAIRLLFRPYNPVRFLVWHFQGLIPKRKHDIAVALGNVISTELITGQDVVSSLTSHDIKVKVAHKVKKHIEESVMDRLPFVIPKSLQEAVADYAGRAVSHEVNNFLENPYNILNDDDMEDMKKEIKRIVENKVLSFDMQRLEELTYELARNEFKHIELLGGLLGFLIGVIQALLTIRFYL